MILETVKNTNRAARLLLVFSVICGGIYPLIVTAIGKTLFPAEANGSQILKGEAIIGSELIAQKFTQPKYFHSRPSAADFATIPSGASNQSPTSKSLAEAIQERRKTYGDAAPSDLLTASASGLDPHITPESAQMQIKRIVAARGLDQAGEERLRTIVANNSERPTLGFLGKDRVNVLKLNIHLDQELP
ncbi:MAG: potassium-transporting ATPase subunit KdpC [Proteobacteria bacterium]|nr:potassium-transporting ATPase subunit KdpC [Pseudomonadota bacterium]